MIRHVVLIRILRIMEHVRTPRSSALPRLAWPDASPVSSRPLIPLFSTCPARRATNEKHAWVIIRFRRISRFGRAALLADKPHTSGKRTASCDENEAWHRSHGSLSAHQRYNATADWTHHHRPCVAPVVVSAAGPFSATTSSRAWRAGARFSKALRHGAGGGRCNRAPVVRVRAGRPGWFRGESELWST